MLKSRVITAVILLALLLLALFALPVAGWTALVILMVLQGTSEWARLAGLGGRSANLYWWATLLMMLGMVWFDGHRSFEQQILPHLLVYGVSALLWLIIVPVWMMTGWKARQSASGTEAAQRRAMPPTLMVLTGWAVLIPTGLAMLDLRVISPWLLLFVMGLVWVADISAYFAGRRFGRNKLAPSISPGKTWEGVIGAMLGVSLYVVLVWGYSPYSGHGEILPGLLLASWWWVGLAVFGDLFESLIKRQAGVKDSGALLPGHGGLLDRIDALTSTLPLAALAILLQHLG
ncbi:MAG TPA: phosphatidate cytidylyltransferase [Gallionella sp.]|nr:phosphatidate cytidylyltransferase [Gallionella sp.]